VSRARLVWTTLGLVGLALLTGLVALAAMRSTAPLPAPTPQGSALTGPASVEPSPTPTGKLSDRRVQLVEPPLALANARVAYRGTTGACDDQATLQRSVDGGRSWRPLQPPVRQLLTVRAVPPSGVDLVGSGAPDGAGCRTVAWTSTDAGRAWDGPSSAAAQWYRDPDRPREVHTPGGPVATPCPNPNLAALELVGLSATDAAVLCPKGRVLRTLDGGVTWSRTAVVPGAVALAWESRDLGWLLDVSDAQCPSVRLLQTVDGGVSWRVGGCLGLEPVQPEQGLLPSLAFADGDVGMAVVGDAVFTTRDGGYGWRQVG
jgi:hypothetical protein